MTTRSATRVAALLLTTVAVAPASAEPLSLDLSSPPPAANPHRIPMGTAKNPAGSEIAVDGVSLLRDGRRWLPVMGEFHYSRYPDAEWRDELLKMKAGGVDVVSTYVFWIHHEEVEGTWDWSGRRDLRRFVQLCGEVGLSVVVRCGPWDHGEVHNGGLPDWLVAKGYKLRTDDAGYLKDARSLYEQIGRQVKGLLWKDGGPIVGVQLENEYRGRADHLLGLKKMAQDVGLDVPIYTRTGWPELTTPMPFGQMLPLFGGYFEGFWDRKLTTMPGVYWKEFAFKSLRTDAAIASEHFGDRVAQDEAESQRYPYLTCELGGGMMSAYHRRILVIPKDIVAVPLVKVGSGSNLPGYYMYHGGTNPGGARPDLQETQASAFTNYNDLPQKTYDFQAPLGEFGQIRPHYHMLRRLHLFLHDFGEQLAAMPPFIPDAQPSSKEDAGPVRWAVRSDGKAGFIFVNNYQRLQPMPPRKDARFDLKLAGGALSVPAAPVTLPADASFVWPFNLDLGGGAKLVYATAQPVCRVDDGDVRYTVFAATGVPAEFAFDAAGLTVVGTTGTASTAGGRITIADVKPGTGAAVDLRADGGKRHRIILLDEAASLTCWKATLAGRERIFLTTAGLTTEGDALRLSISNAGDDTVAVVPAPGSLTATGTEMAAEDDGVFRRYSVAASTPDPLKVELTRTRDAGPPREIKMGRQKVAEGPVDADFDGAATWRVKFNGPLDPARRLTLHVRYAGDVARAYAGTTLLTDNFYNGTAFDVGLTRSAAVIPTDGLTLKILPLRKDAPVYMLPESLPDFAGKDTVARVDGVDVTEERTVELRAN